MKPLRTFAFPKIDRIVHGPGAVAQIPRLVDQLAKQRVFVITGRTLATSTPLISELEAALGARHAGTFAAMRQHAPRTDVDAATVAAREAGAGMLIGFGGSSVTDATKIVAVQLLAPHDPQLAMPQILVPTTLSSGEYTPASGMTGDVAGVKTYVVDPRMAPFAVVLDPVITLHTPLDLWLSTGIKSIDHACEALWGPRPHPFTDVLAVAAIERLVAALARTHAQPDDIGARSDAQLAGWMSMAGISNVQVYLSHTLGHQIGARWDVPHGVTSGITLPVVMRYLHRESPAAMPRIAAAFGIDVVGMTSEEACQSGAGALERFVTSLDLPTRLRDVGAVRDDFDAVAHATVDAGRSTGFGGSTTHADVVALLEEMW